MLCWWNHHQKINEYMLCDGLCCLKFALEDWLYVHLHWLADYYSLRSQLEARMCTCSVWEDQNSRTKRLFKWYYGVLFFHLFFHFAKNAFVSKFSKTRLQQPYPMVVGANCRDPWRLGLVCFLKIVIFLWTQIEINFEFVPFDEIYNYVVQIFSFEVI
jgi:hypothetical protein